MKLFFHLFFLLSLITSCQTKEKQVYKEDGQLNTTIIEIKEPRQIASVWNNAINNRRWDILNGLYSDEVYYYKNERSKSRCIKSKQKAVERDKHFSQSIHDVNVAQTYYNTYEIYFQKVFKSGNEQDTILAFLSVTKDKEKGWQIIQESDLITSRNKGDKICNCSDFWAALYNGGNSEYYLLSGGWENEIVYIGSDGHYWLHVQYYLEEEEGYVHFVEREDRPTHTSRTDELKFDLKNKVMTNEYWGETENKVIIEKYNKRFFRRLEEFCR